MQKGLWRRPRSALSPLVAPHKRRAPERALHPTRVVCLPDAERPAPPAFAEWQPFCYTRDPMCRDQELRDAHEGDVPSRGVRWTRERSVPS